MQTAVTPIPIDATPLEVKQYLEKHPMDNVFPVCDSSRQCPEDSPPEGGLLGYVYRKDLQLLLSFQDVETSSTPDW